MAQSRIVDRISSAVAERFSPKRFVRTDERHLELRPESRNPEHRTIRIDLAKHILHIDRGHGRGAHREIVMPDCRGSEQMRRK